LHIDVHKLPVTSHGRPGIFCRVRSANTVVMEKILPPAIFFKSRLQLSQSGLNYLKLEKGRVMKRKEKKTLAQPRPFTPGVTRGMVRQHAFELYRDKLAHSSLSVEDWVLAEKDLVQMQETDGLQHR